MHKVYTPQSRRFSKAEYHQMHDLGFFADQFVELLDGEIMEMPAPGHRHCVCSDKCMDEIRPIFRLTSWVRHEMPLDLSPFSEPVPDLAVVPGLRDAHSVTPKFALLIIEISETSLAEDRGRKASLYAAAGIADYWIINLVDNQLEVHRNPIADANEPFGFRYADVTVLNANDVVSPLASPQATISVSQLLP